MRFIADTPHPWTTPLHHHTTTTTYLVCICNVSASYFVHTKRYFVCMGGKPGARRPMIDSTCHTKPIINDVPS